jgi:hypothetical protein
MKPAYASAGVVDCIIGRAEGLHPGGRCRPSVSVFSYWTVREIVKLPAFGSGAWVFPVVLPGTPCAAETATCTLVVPVGVTAWVVELPHPDMLPMEPIVNKDKATAAPNPEKPRFPSRLRARRSKRPDNPAMPHGSPLAVGVSGCTLVLMMN